jgi:hypothetical protein
MTQVIIYPQDNGAIAVVIPTGELPLSEVAKKDVPAGTPYLLINAADVPTDSAVLEAWEVDFSSPDGHGIGADAYFAAQEAKQA